MPSILDEVATAGVPSRRLDWHYRSRDEALIAFSNHFYYGDRLVTFPAAATGSEALKFHNVNGTYARGSGRVNVDEAKAIAEMVKRRLTTWLALQESARHTLGVITFNGEQQSLILDLLDEIRRENSRLEWFFADEREEPVIVKNLESIQGDERDVMLFSVTFGPDLAGKLTMNFGALNSPGGEKRLNVAITRARRELHVFSSIRAEQIDLERTRAVGVRDLKAFLDYAERGSIALPSRDEGSLGPAENAFEEAVAEAFRSKGWEVRTQIGVSGFRVDLGVVQGHGVGVADGGGAKAPAHVPAQEDRAVPAGADAQAEAGDHVVPDIVFLGAGLGGADALGEGGFGSVAGGSGAVATGPMLPPPPPPHSASLPSVALEIRTGGHFAGVYRKGSPR